MHLRNMASPGVVLTSDASGNWGCGAYSGPHWFMLPWTGSIADSHITVKELIPIVIAGAMWGCRWRGSTVLAQCDNMAVVHIVNHGSSKNQDAMHLARCLAFITAKLDFHVVASHIKGAHNVRADALSRDKPLLVPLATPTGQARRSTCAAVSSRSSDSVQAILDIQALDRAVDRHFQNGLASSTQRTYNSAKRRYLQFCKDKRICPLPAPERQLCWFVSSLALQSLCHSTIKSYLAAIRHLQAMEIRTSITWPD